MNKLRKNKLVVVFGALITLCLVSVSALILNRGFHYAEFEEKVLVDVTSNTSLFDKVSDLDGISKVDKENLEVEFQHKNYEDISEEVNKIIANDSTYTNDDVRVATEASEDVANLIVTIFFAIGIILGAFLLGTYYVLFRNEDRISASKIVVTLAIPLIFIIVSSVLQLGLLSLLSRLYQIKLVELYTLPVGTYIALILYLLSVRKIQVHITEDKSKILKHISNDYTYTGKWLMLTGAIVILFITFGLGLQFVVSGAILLVALLNYGFVPLAVIQFVDTITQRKNHKSELKRSKSSPTIRKGKSNKNSKKKSLQNAK